MRLVLLHALPLDGRMWAEQMDLLPGATIAPNLFGLGDSLEEWARAVVEQTEGEQLVVVGASVGGSCALEVAALVPDRVEAIVLAGAKASHRRETAFRDEAIRALRTEGIGICWDKYWAPLFGRATDSTTVDGARALAFDQPIDDIIRGTRAFHERRDLTDFAHSWTKPLVVISGDQDQAPTPATGTQLATDVPDGQFHLVADCGHYVNLEQPAVFDRIVRSVIERVATLSCRMSQNE